MKKNVNLETKNGTVTNVIVKSWKKITSLFEDMAVSTEDFKAAVTDVVNEAKVTPGQKKVLMNVAKQRDKVGVMSLVTNTMLSGSGCPVIK